MEFNDVERIRQAVPEVEVITPNISRWGSTAISETRKAPVPSEGYNLIMKDRSSKYYNGALYQ